MDEKSQIEKTGHDSPTDDIDQHQHLEDLKHSVSVDTVHNDEAVKVLANYHGEESWTPEEEKKLTRKIDRRLLSILIITYGLQYYDKAMLSQAVRAFCIPSYFLPYSNLISCTGSLWSTNGPQARSRQPVLLLVRHLLPWLHLRCISGNRHGPALPNRARHFQHCAAVGRMPHVHGRRL